MKLIGHCLIDFTPEGQSNPIKFGRLYLGVPITQNGSGLRVEAAKCSVEFYNSTVKSVPVNSDVDVSFDKYKRVAFLNVLNK